MQYNSNDVRNIAFEKINDRFSKGKYLGIEVTIDMTNGYINGPHLVGQVKTKGGKPKEFKHWREIALAKEILEYLAVDMATVTPIIDVTDAPNGLRGAYIHPRLVSHVAQWASPIFADKVSIILLDRAINEALQEKRRELQEKEDSIVVLQRKIDELLGFARKADEDLEHTRVELDEIAAESNETNKRLDVIQEKLEIAVERRVPRDPINRRNEIFAIYHKPNTFEYRVVRCQYRSWNTSKSRCTENGFTVQVYFKEDPNAVNIYNRVKTQIPVRIGRAHSGYYITLHPTTTVDQLVEFVNEIEQERKQVY